MPKKTAALPAQTTPAIRVARVVVQWPFSHQQELQESGVIASIDDHDIPCPKKTVPKQTKNSHI